MGLTLRDAVEILLTLVLVAITARYVLLTGSMAKSAKEQIRLVEEQIGLSTTPNVLFQATPHWSIVNLGQYGVHVQAVWVEQLSPTGEKVVGHGLLTTGTQVLLDWKKAIGPNDEVRIQIQTMPPGAAAQLSGQIRLVFYFVYGPTGHSPHSLDLTMEVGSLGKVNVHEQVIHLNQAIPQVPATQIDQIQPVRKS